VTFVPTRTSGSYTVTASGNGRTLKLGSGSGSSGVAWNTETTRNGYYTVTAYDANGTQIESAQVLVNNPRAAAPQVAAATATSVAVTVGATAFGSQIAQALSTAKEWALNVSEEQFKQRFGSGKKARGAVDVGVAAKSFHVTVPAILGAGLVVGLAYTYADASVPPPATIAAFLAALPVDSIGVALAFLAVVAVEHSYALHLGNESRFRVWGPGAVSLALSTLVFTAPFGPPGFIVGHETEERLLEGRRGVVGFAILLALAVPFSLLVLVNHGLAVATWGLYQSGTSMALMLAAGLVIPIGDTPGGLVWRWHKGLWALCGGVVVSVYAASQIFALPPAAYLTFGFLGVLGLLFVFFSERWLPDGELAAARARLREERERERREEEEAEREGEEARHDLAEEGEEPVTLTPEPPPRTIVPEEPRPPAEPPSPERPEE
jgi:hypothetical protein